VSRPQDVDQMRGRIEEGQAVWSNQCAGRRVCRLAGQKGADVLVHAQGAGAVRVAMRKAAWAGRDDAHPVPSLASRLAWSISATGRGGCCWPRRRCRGRPGGRGEQLGTGARRWPVSCSRSGSGRWRSGAGRGDRCRPRPGARHARRSDCCRAAPGSRGERSGGCRNRQAVGDFAAVSWMWMWMGRRARPARVPMRSKLSLETV
jgi:hypothetical protein